MEDLSKKDLLDLLVKDRNYHFEHPNQVNNKLVYSLGGSLSTIMIGLVIKKGEKAFEVVLEQNHWIMIGLIGLGYTVMIWGLAEHTLLHFNQRKVLQKAIHYILSGGTYQGFIDQFAENHLAYMRKKRLKVATKIFDIEPDTRPFWRYHDRKIELGIILVIFGVLGLLYFLLKG